LELHDATSTAAACRARVEPLSLQATADSYLDLYAELSAA
jgi:hypothetical protein